MKKKSPTVIFKGRLPGEEVELFLKLHGYLPTKKHDFENCPKCQYIKDWRVK